MRTDSSFNRAADGHRYEALDSLRGIAACVVLFFHVYAPQGRIWNLPLVHGGWLFVDFFFVLSGFVIFASYGDRLRSGFSIGRFMMLRAGRIYPLHAAILAVFVLYETLALVMPGLLGREPFSGPNQPADLWLSVLLLQIFEAQGVVWNGPSWSIAAEFWTYLVAALLFAFARRLFWPAVATLIVASGAYLALFGHYMREVESLALLRCLYGFGFGMIAFAVFRRFSEGLRLSFGLATAVELLLAAGGLVFVSLAGRAGWPTMLAGPAFAAGVFMFAFQRGALSRLLLAAPLRLLGTLSYSIYLTHAFLIERLLDVLEKGGWTGFARVGTFPGGQRYIDASPWVSDLLAVAVFAAAIAVSSLSYRLVERPARDWSRRVAQRMGRSPARLASVRA